MGQEGTGGPAFDLDGGALCLDFANTAGYRPRGSKERLQRIEDLLRWAAQAGLMSSAALQRHRRQAARRPRSGRLLLARARLLREAVYRIFSARARGAVAAPADLVTLNEALRRALPRQRLVQRGRGFEWQWEGADTLELPLWAVARSAADLLLSPSRVEECAGAGCAWLFMDRSRGGRRRWCDMKSCGNRAKARRFYERRKRKRGR